MRPLKLTIEQVCYLTALVLALVVRFIHLGQLALPDQEAALALQAMKLSQGGAPLLGPNPGYVLPTALLMFIGGVSNWTARFWPALFGVLLTLAPYLLRERIGRGAAVILAFFLALDPGLVAVSRQVGDQMIGLSAVVLTLAFCLEGKAVWAGIFAGFTLLGGPAQWPNALALAAAWLIAFRPGGLATLVRLNLRAFGLALLAVLMSLGTCFFFAPASLSAGLASLPAYLNGWVVGGGVPVLRMAAGLGAYELFGLALALGGLARGLLQGSRVDRFLAIWWGLGLVLALAYPARQVFDLTWTLAPMLVLAARWADPLMNPESDRNAVAGQSALVLLLVVMICNLVVSWPVQQTSPSDVTFRYLVLVIALVLIGAETFLVSWGWSSQIGLNGLALGIASALFLFSLATMGNASGLSNRPAAELWRAGPAFPQADLLARTLHDYSSWRTPAVQTPEVVLLDLQSPALEWLLRDYPGLRLESGLPVALQPDFILTADGVKLDQTAAYTGTGMDLTLAPVWDQIGAGDWVSWLAYRSVRADAWNRKTVILWVRSDIFPGVEVKVTKE